MASVMWLPPPPLPKTLTHDDIPGETEVQGYPVRMCKSEVLPTEQGGAEKETVDMHNLKSLFACVFCN